MRIAIDFDGTIVEHKFPDIGREVPGAFEWMKKWQEAGAELILWTMRSDRRINDPSLWGLYLTFACQYCAGRGIFFAGVNHAPHGRDWTDSPKVYAHIYVDDAAFGCPLTESREMGARPYVDWDIVGPAVLERIEQETP